MSEILPAFVSADEIADLRARAAAAPAAAWKAGRQGTGYDTLPLRAVAELAPLLARGLARVGAPWQDYWDAYLIRYLDGSSIPPHTDPGQHGRRHRRINALLAPPRAGGDLVIAGAPIALAVGDAVLFYPDEEVHSVTAVSGERLLFSVGAWLA